ncbi:MAG: hypothetical protein LIO92_08640 [Clostridiales bacterium]|nr:hypothetical protein [Clostridiales bacterium]
MMNGNAMDASVCYSRDRPKKCEFCYYWKGRLAGCSLGEQNCFYIIHDADYVDEDDEEDLYELPDAYADDDTDYSNGNDSGYEDNEPV